MEKNETPKLRTVNKSKSAFKLNQFSKDFPYRLGRELIYILASKGKPELEGSEWESIFADCIGAEWKPSNVGLDDVILGNTAWGAKTVKSSNPSKQKKIRLISGRNSPVFSFGSSIDTTSDPSVIGSQVLQIWNERVSAIREKFKHLRTVVLIKSGNLQEVVVFEFETVRFDTELFSWEWNKNNNLIGKNKKTAEHKFTWQPHGSQFTIIENVPDESLIIQIKQPQILNKEEVLQALGVDDAWIKVQKKRND